MTAFLQGWGFTIGALALITVVFVVAQVTLRQQLGWVKALADYLGYDLAVGGKVQSKHRPPVSLRTEAIRDEASAILAASDPAWAQKQVSGWLMRAQRLEPALAFWVDFLRQLGLLFTVLGLGLSLAMNRTDIAQLLAPLGLAVWTTVAGLFFSLWLTAQFGMQAAAWADTCEKNVEAWDSRRRAAPREHEPGAPERPPGAEE